MTRAAQTNPHCNQEVLPRRGAHPLAYDMWQIGLSPGERTSGRSSERDSITLRTAGGQKSDAKIPPLALTLQNLRQFLPKVSLTALRGSGLWRAFDAEREARAHLPAWRAIPSVRAEGPQLRPGVTNICNTQSPLRKRRARSQPTQADSRITLQKLIRLNAGSLSARTSSLTVPNVLSGLC